jgi:phosphohistidine phosphatase
MPRILLAMRHAKSSWDDEGLADIDRPLSPRGKRDALHMGETLRARGLWPQIVLCSPARRAHSTARRILRADPGETPVTIVESLYPGTDEAILAALACLPDTLISAMVVAHNPGMEELVSAMAGRLTPMPTAAVAIIELQIESWRQAPQAQGRLKLWLTPRELPEH